MFKHLCRN